MDIEVVIHKNQPLPFIIKNVKDEIEGIEKALEFCWENYPGFFSLFPEDGEVISYKNRYLQFGYPLTKIINWH